MLFGIGARHSSLFGRSHDVLLPSPLPPARLGLPLKHPKGDQQAQTQRTCSRDGNDHHICPYRP